MKPRPKTTQLTLTRTIAARPADVYDVWIDPASPGGPWHGAPHAIVNVTVDGLFFHAVQHEGRTWAHYGRFVELTRPSKVVYTWMSEATQGIETTVTVAFEPEGDHTVVTLIHADVPDDDDGRSHAGGWGWMLDIIRDRFAAKS